MSGVSYLGLPSTQRRQLEETRRERLWMSRSLAAVFAVGMAFGLMWIALGAPVDSWVMYTYPSGVLSAIVSLALTDPRLPKQLFAIPLLTATATYVVGAVHYEQVAAGFFMLMPGMFTAVFFWKDRLLAGALIAIFTAAFAATPLLVDGAAAVPRVVQTAPIYLALVLLVGYLGSQGNQMRSERGRFQSTISSLLVALQERDGYTADHSEETVDLAMAVGDELAIDDEERSVLVDVALLHDIGKIGIPNEILNKPEQLDDHEWEFMKKHPEIGERIVAPVPGFGPVAKAIRHEHERWDGGGYPDGISGETIPLASRVVLVCDAYHAMITDRPYRASIGEKEARQELLKHAGTQFDPQVVDALLAVIDKGLVPDSVGNAGFTHATNSVAERLAGELADEPAAGEAAVSA